MAIDISTPIARFVSNITTIPFVPRQEVEIVAFQDALIVIYKNMTGQGRIEEYSTEHLQSASLRKVLPLYNYTIDYPPAFAASYDTGLLYTKAISTDPVTLINSTVILVHKIGATYHSSLMNVIPTNTLSNATAGKLLFTASGIINSFLLFATNETLALY